MKPKIQKDIIFNNDCSCIVDYEILERALIWFSEGVLKSKRKIYMHSGYPCVTSYRKKIHVHRLIGIYLWGEKMSKGSVIHHKDENALNSSIDNLEVMDACDHGRYHNTRRVFSDSHKRKIADASRKRKGIKMKRKYDIAKEDLKNRVENGESILSISKFYGCDWTVVKSRIDEYGLTKPIKTQN